MTVKELRNLLDAVTEALEYHDSEVEHTLDEIAEKIFDGSRLLGYVILEIEESDLEKRFEVYSGLSGSVIERIENLRFVGCKIKVYI